MPHPPHANLRVNLDFDIYNSRLSMHVLLHTVLHFGALLRFLDSTEWLWRCAILKQAFHHGCPAIFLAAAFTNCIKLSLCFHIVQKYIERGCTSNGQRSSIHITIYKLSHLCANISYIGRLYRLFFCILSFIILSHLCTKILSTNSSICD